MNLQPIMFPDEYSSLINDKKQPETAEQRWQRIHRCLMCLAYITLACMMFGFGLWQMGTWSSHLYDPCERYVCSMTHEQDVSRNGDYGCHFQVFQWNDTCYSDLSGPNASNTIPSTTSNNSSCTAPAKSCWTFDSATPTPCAWIGHLPCSLNRLRIFEDGEKCPSSLPLDTCYDMTIAWIMIPFYALLTVISFGTCNFFLFRMRREC